MIENMDNETQKSVVTRISVNHGDEANIETNIVSDDPGVYYSRLNFLRDLFEKQTPRNILLADAVDLLSGTWNESSGIDQVAGTADLG